jgi:uncharacterized sulfatase
MLELAGAKVPSNMQGRSFVGALRGQAKPSDWRKGTYNRYWMHMAHGHNNPAHFGIRTEQYKLIFFYGCDFTDILWGRKITQHGGNRYFPNTPPAWEFYDLKTDPNEMHNLYANPKYAKEITELKKELKQLRKELKETDADYPHIQKIIDAHWDD